MRYLLALSMLLAGCSMSKVDPTLVGTWEMVVPNDDGVARWVWDIRADGTYAFHAEGPGNVPSHSGTFAARHGRYTLRSTTISWADTGTYQPVHNDTLNATGKLGTGAWHRVTLAPVSPPPPPPAANDSAPPLPTRPGKVAPATIYSYLGSHALPDSVLEAPLRALNTATVNLTTQAQAEGVIGEVRTTVHGPATYSEIEYRVFRDRATAEADFSAEADYESKTFRQKPGELVSSHAFTYHERGEERCLARNMPHESKDAPITCYLLVQLPRQEAVMIIARVNSTLIGNAAEPSADEFQRGNHLLLAGIKHWEMSWNAMTGATGH